MTHINLMSLAFETDRFQLDHLIIHNILQPLLYLVVFSYRKQVFRGQKSTMTL